MKEEQEPTEEEARKIWEKDQAAEQEHRRLIYQAITNLLSQSNEKRNFDNCLAIVQLMCSKLLKSGGDFENVSTLELFEFVYKKMTVDIRAGIYPCRA